jgi:hypothetical protein
LRRGSVALLWWRSIALLGRRSVPLLGRRSIALLGRRSTCSVGGRLGRHLAATEIIQFNFHMTYLPLDNSLVDKNMEKQIH